MMGDPMGILERFAEGCASFHELEIALRKQVRFRFSDVNLRSVEILSDLPVVTISAEDVGNALQRYLGGAISAREISDWAATLRLLDCYDLLADDNADTVWHTIDVLMAPSAWGPLTSERALQLLREL